MAYNEFAERKALQFFNKNELEDTLKVLMNAYGDELFRFCHSMLNNTADAQDTLQLVFVQAFEGFSAFNGDAKFRTWLYAIARNRCLDLIKKKQRLHQRVEFVERIPEQANNDENASVDCDDHVFNDILQRCLNKLSNTMRAAILLRFQSELTYEEASDILREKAGTIQARVVRALPALRQCVEKEGLLL